MASAKPYLTIFSLLFIFTISLSSTPSFSQSPTPPSVFDILPIFGLPSGLLPNCVNNYTLSPDDGAFVVDLDTSCYIQFDYLVYYEKRITGTLKIGSITNLKGIQVKRFLFWFDVDEIKVDLPPSDSIYFQVGLINKKLNVHQFETIHSCRDSVSAARGGHLRSWSFELPPPIDGDIPMLLTE
ncbi:uncharacterized protein LOC110736109 [Chenopodium quinoa]|uniref:uncharacterized protein LOC110736109 n=1 Tax=Chenopodium quinoa TaxID=63459 RepID=UPI000B789A07|nr:uncharacterized protein LOC110736109 [Chenopodium quinoa]